MEAMNVHYPIRPNCFMLDFEIISVYCIRINIGFLSRCYFYQPRCCHQLLVFYLGATFTSLGVATNCAICVLIIIIEFHMLTVFV